MKKRMRKTKQTNLIKNVKSKNIEKNVNKIQKKGIKIYVRKVARKSLRKGKELTQNSSNNWGICDLIMILLKLIFVLLPAYIITSNKLWSNIFDSNVSVSKMVCYFIGIYFLTRAIGQIGFYFSKSKCTILFGINIIFCISCYIVLIFFSYRYSSNGYFGINNLILTFSAVVGALSLDNPIIEYLKCDRINTEGIKCFIYFILAIIFLITGYKIV